MDSSLIKAFLLLAAVTVHAPLLMGLSSRRRGSGHPVLRFFLWGVSAAHTPLMSYVLWFLTSSLSSMKESDDQDEGGLGTEIFIMYIMLSVVLIQFLKAKTDMAALAVAAVTSPVAGDDIDSLKIRPSMEGVINGVWVAGLVIYSIFLHAKGAIIGTDYGYMIMLIVPLWALGGCRMLLRFAAYRTATSSFALGRSVQLISGYMAYLQQTGCFEAEGQVPRLIVTGERNRDVEESPTGHRVKLSVLDDKRSRLVTLDRVWLERDLRPELKDLCLSFALFKCLRRRFAGHRLAEAGSTWAYHFFSGGLLGRQDDHERIFRVIAGELSFARDFYYSPLPMASLGTVFAALHFFLSLLVSAYLVFLPLLLILLGLFPIFGLLALVVAAAIVVTEISEMAAGVRSKWTKISIISHYMSCRNRCVRRIFSCLLRRNKSPKYWKDEIGQAELLKPSHFCDQPWARLFKNLFIRRKTRHKPVIKVPPEVKAAVLASFRSCGGRLSGGTATLRRRCIDVTWASQGDEITTTTDVLLVWHIATSFFEIRWSASSSSTRTASMVVAQSLSRYCAYLVAEAPDLLPDDSAWTKRRYEAVKKGIEEASKSSNAVPESGVYGHLIVSFSAESCHDVLNKGSRLGKQLVEEAERQRSGEGDAEDGAGHEEDTVWELLAEFWSEMVLYLAPSDNVKVHIEALQRGGELMTLLWALLVHAGITGRPARCVPEP
ncbi:uncharacterized protein LOC101755236 [Setaria italica]|uniref:uncharacterized protein LOC101755236 n=1 Tax=Setaria italica TaxID=4555 RepID=UPI000350B7FF|nr:uncharacterized protein LOC101755236 [Setaria italica]